MKNSRGQHKYSAPDPPKFKKGQDVLVHGEPTKIEFITPVNTGYLYTLIDRDGYYNESEIHSKD